MDTIDTLIGRNTLLVGDLEFSGKVRVDGQIKGSVIARDTSDSTLVLSEPSEVEGTISVPHVIVNGTVKGGIKSFGRVELQAKSKVFGDVHYGVVAMEDGATFNGNLAPATAKTSKSQQSTQSDQREIFGSGGD